MLTLCDPMDCSLPGSSLLGILQARMLEWVAISFSRASSWPGQGSNLCLLCLLHWEAGSLPLTPSVKPQVGTWIPLVLPMNHIHLSKETVWLYDISPLMLTNILWQRFWLEYNTIHMQFTTYFLEVSTILFHIPNFSAIVFPSERALTSNFPVCVPGTIFIMYPVILAEPSVLSFPINLSSLSILSLQVHYHLFPLPHL